MVTFSAFGDEITGDFAGQVEFLTSMGIRFLEIRSVNRKNVMELDRQELIEARNILKANGISISAIGSSIGKVKLDEPFDDYLRKFSHVVELSLFFNAPYIRIFSYYAPDGKRISECREEVLQRMFTKVEMLKGSEIVLVHENETHIYGHSAAACADMARSINSPNFKLVYDPGNFVWGGGIADNMHECWPLVEQYVVHVHIKDWKLGSERTGSIPGEGDAQIKELLEKLAGLAYRGFLTMEPHLESGGQFGGNSGPLLFEKAFNATRNLCELVGLEYK